MAARIRKGDLVYVTRGRDKGKNGRVLAIQQGNDRIIVEGIHIAKKHMKESPLGPAGIIDKPMPIHVSNVMPVDPATAGGDATKYVPTRVRIVRDAEGKTSRVSVKSGETIVAAPLVESAAGAESSSGA